MPHSTVKGEEITPTLRRVSTTTTSIETIARNWISSPPLFST